MRIHATQADPPPQHHNPVFLSYPPNTLPPHHTPHRAAATRWMPLLLFVRAVMGLGEGVAFPTMQAIIKGWVPADKRSRSLRYRGGGRVRASKSQRDHGRLWVLWSPWGAGCLTYISCPIIAGAQYSRVRMSP